MPQVGEHWLLPLAMALAAASNREVRRATCLVLSIVNWPYYYRWTA